MTIFKNDLYNDQTYSILPPNLKISGKQMARKWGKTNYSKILKLSDSFSRRKLHSIDRLMGTGKERKAQYEDRNIARYRTRNQHDAFRRVKNIDPRLYRHGNTCTYTIIDVCADLVEYLRIVRHTQRRLPRARTHATVPVTYPHVHLSICYLTLSSSLYSYRDTLGMHFHGFTTRTFRVAPARHRNSFCVADGSHARLIFDNERRGCLKSTHFLTKLSKAFWSCAWRLEHCFVKMFEKWLFKWFENSYLKIIIC